MKFSFTTKSESLAKKFQEGIKEERKLESELKKTDTGYEVEYSVATVSTADDKGENVDVRSAIDSAIQWVMYEIQYRERWLQNRLDDIYDYMDEHRKGHLPPINGAEKMEKALKVLGIGEDYEVRKPVIFARASEGVYIKDLS